ncbi:hypothetical protein WJX77_011108 [Trebouxia sp. C0004]
MEAYAAWAEACCTTFVDAFKRLWLEFSSGLRPANATLELLPSPGQADRSTADQARSGQCRCLIERDRSLQEPPILLLLGKHHHFTRDFCKTSRRVVGSKWQEQQDEEQKHSQMQTSSQPALRQAASQPERTARPQRVQQQPHHHTGHKKQPRSNLDQVRQTGEYIKVHKHQLLESVRGSQPELTVQSFYQDMSALCSRPESCIHHMHLDAIIGATAKAWNTA